MKFPKNRANVFAVVREGYDTAICGVFANVDEADDYRAACEQEWLEKTGNKIYFWVTLTTFYG